jgi:hypothetical protein
MIVTTTKRVLHHHTNDNFNCVVVKFEPRDAINLQRMDWLPSFDDLGKIIKAFVKLDRTYVTPIENMLYEAKEELETQQSLGRWKK